MVWAFGAHPGVYPAIPTFALGDIVTYNRVSGKEANGNPSLLIVHCQHRESFLSLSPSLYCFNIFPFSA